MRVNERKSRFRGLNLPTMLKHQKAQFQMTVMMKRAKVLVMLQRMKMISWMMKMNNWMMSC